MAKYKPAGLLNHNILLQIFFGKSFSIFCSHSDSICFCTRMEIRTSNRLQSGNGEDPRGGAGGCISPA